MLIGYARVSTQDQNLELQREALSKAGCKKVFEDKVSGTRADRPGLAKTLEMLREGDTLVVWKLDRLGRSVKQLVDLVGELHKHGVQFRSLTDSIDTGTPSGRFFFHVMASLAEMERELTVERTRAGLEVAKQLGRKGGRKPKMTDSKIESAKKLLASGVPPKDVAKNLGRRVHSDAVPLGASLHARLACFIFRFLRRPLVALHDWGTDRWLLWNGPHIHGYQPTSGARTYIAATRFPRWSLSGSRRWPGALLFPLAWQFT